ncbi:CGNR zinc finger domain-containing protein [uncultured Tateyamaria sp.]|uniref:CGNR zinc finger domain-containing protein n=1 Tax=uncultured Tateyamaria sp. TaxID=455651 RepID=UPI00261DC9BD|nr:CGNR zinc finger domain-containing protein [uncultured Tateyamaria sp.]
MKKDTPSFQFVGNDTSLDLVNTRVMTHGVVHDLINTDAGRAAWMAAAQLGPVANAWSDNDNRQLQRLRDAIAQLVAAAIDGSEAAAADMTIVNQHLGERTNAIHLTAQGAQFRLEEDKGPKSPDAVMGDIADSAAHLLVETNPKRLKRCAHPDCVLVFRDTSKSGRRRWCDMATCGNRAKVAAFRAGAGGAD